MHQHKRTVTEELLKRGSIFIHLDPRQPHVQCPPWLRNQARLVLHVGLEMAVPIPDFHVDEDGIFGTLLFNLTPIQCFCPWDAIFAIVSDEGAGHMWQDSMPPEIAGEFDQEHAHQGKRVATSSKAASSPARAASTRRRRVLPPGWRVIK